MNDSKLAEQVRALVDAVEPVTLDEIAGPRLTGSDQHQRRVRALALVTLLLVAVAAVGVILLAQLGRGDRGVSVQPVAGAGAMQGGREVSPSTVQDGGDAVVLMDDDASTGDLDGVRDALRGNPAIRTFSVFDEPTIRRQTNRRLGDGVSVDDAPKVRPPAPFVVVDLADGVKPTWSDRIDRLGGVDRILRSEGADGELEGPPDLIEAYAQCVSITAGGWASQVFLRVDASSAEIDALRASLEANPAVRKLQFVDQAAAYEEFARIFRNKPDLVKSISPADLPTSFRVAVRRAQQQAVALALETLPGVDAVQDLSRACAANAALGH